jgi:S1-C subfamily serine protease
LECCFCVPVAPGGAEAGEICPNAGAADGTAADAGLSPGDVVVEVQQETIAGPGDVTRLIALARHQQRRYVAMLVHNADGLRWQALSLD